MNTRTSTLLFIPTATFEADCPCEVSVSVSEADARDWLRLKALAESASLAGLEQPYARCTFLFDGKPLAEVPDMAFTPDEVHLQLKGTHVSFVGKDKTSGDEWTTSSISLNELADYFGLDMAAFAPKVEITVGGGLVSNVWANHICTVDIVDEDGDGDEEVTRSNYHFDTAGAD